MVGKDCVAIACDLRLGLQALTVSNNFPKIFPYGSQVHLGLTGLATDVQTVSELFRYKHNMYRLREERDISPQTFANLVSSSLYERRFGPWFVSPVVAVAVGVALANEAFGWPEAIGMAVMLSATALALTESKRAAVTA